MSGLAVWGATSRGIGLSPDSLQYLDAAATAAAGDGLTTLGWEGEPTPLAHYPPAYPLLLASATRLGWSPQRFALVLNIALFMATIVLVAVITHRIVPESRWAAPMAASLCALAPDLVDAHSMVWTEPLYLTLTAVGLLALATALMRNSKRLLALAALAGGVSAIVRYVGVANIGVLPLAVLLWWPASVWRRFRAAAAISAFAAIPLLVVLVLSAGAGDATLANREFAWHPIGAADLRLAAVVVGKWVTPLSDANYVTAVWLSALFVLVVFVTLRARRTPSRRMTPDGRMLIRVLLLYAGTYTAVLVVSMSIVDAQTTFEPRFLTPILTVSIILGVVALAHWARRDMPVRLATAAIIVLALGAGDMRLLSWLRQARADGLALRRPDPRADALVEATRRLPPTAKLYSNDPYFLRVQAQRMVAGLPRERDPYSLLPNSRHADQVQALCDSAVSRPTHLILFDKPKSDDSTAKAPPATRTGDAVRMPGGVMIRVRPRCAL